MAVEWREKLFFILRSKQDGYGKYGSTQPASDGEMDAPYMSAASDGEYDGRSQVIFLATSHAYISILFLPEIKFAQYLFGVGVYSAIRWISKRF